jgi:hypothetical protein
VREKLNESKAAQIGLVAVLIVVVAVFFLKSSGSESEGGESESGSEAAVETGSGETLAVSTEAAAGMGELPTSVPSAPAPPHAFRLAYDSGEPVALLVVHNGGIDDAYTKLALKFVAKVEHIVVFVVPAKKISRYASVTVGLNIDQVPALIVLRPKDLSHGTPQASVLYGYQTPESIYQAIRDATYQGPEKTTYHPG